MVDLCRFKRPIKSDKVRQSPTKSDKVRQSPIKSDKRGFLNLQRSTIKNTRKMKKIEILLLEKY